MRCKYTRIHHKKTIPKKLFHGDKPGTELCDMQQEIVVINIDVQSFMCNTTCSYGSWHLYTHSTHNSNAIKSIIQLDAIISHSLHVFFMKERKEYRRVSSKYRCHSVNVTLHLIKKLVLLFVFLKTMFCFSCVLTEIDTHVNEKCESESVDYRHDSTIRFNSVILLDCFLVSTSALY